MKPSIFLLALAAVTITSCTSAYKSGQTPDDVYFSPQRPQSDEYVATKDRDDDPGYYNGDDYYGDRYLRMKVQNRYQWSDLDNYYYNDRYSYGIGGGGYSYNNSLYANPWSPVGYWNYYYNPYYNTSFYNPYYSPGIYWGTKYPNYNNNNSVTNRPRTFNLNTYNSNQLTNGNYTNRRFDYNNGNQNNVNNNRYNNNYRNTRTSAGGYLRNAFGGNNNNNSNYNNNNTNSRSYNNNNNNSSSSSSSGGSRSSGSSSSGSSAPVRKF